RIVGELGAGEEERGLHAFFGKDLQDLFRTLWGGTIIEGECHDPILRVHSVDQLAEQLKGSRVGEGPGAGQREYQQEGGDENEGNESGSHRFRELTPGNEVQKRRARPKARR